MDITGWDSYDSWDNPDPANAIVINCLQQAIKERLFVLNIQTRWKFTEKEFLKDTNILHDTYLQILNGLVSLFDSYIKELNFLVDSDYISKSSYYTQRDYWQPPWVNLKSSFNNTKYTSIADEFNQFDVVNIEELFSQYQIFENIPPRGSLPSAWKNFVIGAKAILQELNAISSKGNDNLNIGTMGVRVRYGGSYRSSLTECVEQINSDLQNRASFNGTTTRLAGKRDFIGYVSVLRQM